MQAVKRERPNPRQGTVLDKAIGLSLTHHKPYFTRTADDAVLEEEAAETGAYRVSKEILQSEEYREILRFDDLTYWKVRGWSLPHWFRRGEYLLPIALFERVEDYLTARAEQRALLVEEFLAAYPSRKEEARVRLSCDAHKAALPETSCADCFFDESEYPSVSALRASFGMEWSYPAFGVEGKLETLKRDVFTREKAKIEEKGAKAVDLITVTLRTEVAKLVNHWVDTLRGTVDGKPKKFKSDSLDKARLVLADIHLKNIVDDTALDQLVVDAEALLDGVDATTLRKDDEFRADVLKGFSAIKTSLDTLMVEKPKRRIRFV